MLLKLDLRDEHLNQINALELKMIGQSSSEKKKINDKLNNDLLANDIKRIEKTKSGFLKNTQEINISLVRDYFLKKDEMKV